MLRADGWKLVRQRGSHEQWRHPTKPGVVTVVGKDSGTPDKGTWQSIQRQAAWI